VLGFEVTMRFDGMTSLIDRLCFGARDSEMRSAPAAGSGFWGRRQFVVCGRVTANHGFCNSKKLRGENRMRCPNCGRRAALARMRCAACQSKLVAWYVLAAIIIAGACFGGFMILDKMG